MHLPGPTPDNHLETRIEPNGMGTLTTMRMTLPDAATREAMLKTGIVDGMETSYRLRICSARSIHHYTHIGIPWWKPWL